MNTNKYQVWEGEMEAAELEGNGVSLFAAIFSAMVGILLFFILIAKTIFQAAFKVKATAKRKNATVKTSTFNMSVS
jgi:hypothetical protein